MQLIYAPLEVCKAVTERWQSPPWQVPCYQSVEDRRGAAVQARGMQLKQVLEEGSASYVCGQRGVKPLGLSKDVSRDL